MGAAGCGGEALDEEEAVESDESAIIAPFLLGFQLADDEGEGGFGETRWTPAAAPGSSTVWFSEWAADSNAYDPDAGRVFLDAPGTELRDTDFRLLYRVADHGSSDVGGVQQTPWASEGGMGPLVGAYAVDSNAYDFDSVKLGIETRRAQGLVIRDFRIGVQFADGGGSSQQGTPRFTPWASQGGGASPWAMDANGYDPDGVRLVLDIQR